jgi:stearoyl-CoA desaturase (delta-9 desaturase)
MKEKKPNWKAILVLSITPLLTVVLVPLYAFTIGFCMTDWVIFIIFMILTGLSITAGYHRLWSHKTYSTNLFFRVLYMLFGSAALQNSVFKWASDHRKHHIYVDDDHKDPYSASKGFIYSHIGWMLSKNKKPEIFNNINDLKKDKVLVFQHKYYPIVALFMCFGLPALIGWTYGSIIGCLLLAGLLRLVLNHHFTFFINSLAHIVGSKPFSSKNSARDNPLLSLVTYGEGYHNFHHKFAGDYRNGIKWYDFDPSKWIIALSSKLGWAWNLKITPKPVIENAKLQVQYQKMMEKQLACPSQIKQIKEKLELQYQLFSKSISDWSKAYTEWVEGKKTKLSKARLQILKDKYMQLKCIVQNEKKDWKIALEQFSMTTKKAPY